MSSAINSAWVFLKAPPVTLGQERGMPIDVPTKDEIEMWTAAEASEVRQNINEVHGPQDDRELGQQPREEGEDLGEQRTDFLREPSFGEGV